MFLNSTGKPSDCRPMARWMPSILIPDDEIRKAIATDPLSPTFHHDLAILLSMTGDTAAAIKALEDAARLDEQRSDWGKASSFLNLRDHRKPFSHDLKNPHPSD
ncbi:MAG: tetratricopeptide repeat protein [Akkermansiaceae bacterium]|nr:tetratricopeptide repeat protein [Akkermansiaceae bacterium]